MSEKLNDVNEKVMESAVTNGVMREMNSDGSDVEREKAMAIGADGSDGVTAESGTSREYAETEAGKSSGEDRDVIDHGSDDGVEHDSGDGVKHDSGDGVTDGPDDGVTDAPDDSVTDAPDDGATDDSDDVFDDEVGERGPSWDVVVAATKVQLRLNMESEGASKVKLVAFNNISPKKTDEELNILCDKLASLFAYPSVGFVRINTTTYKPQSLLFK